MKKIFILIISGLFLCFSAMSQELIFKSDVANVRVPKSVKAVSKEEFHTSQMSKRKNSPIDYRKHKGNMYRSDNYLLEINGSITEGIAADFLKQTKDSMDEIYSWGNSYPRTSEIKRIKNNEVLIMNDEPNEETLGNFFVQVVSSSRKATLVITLDYEKDKKAEAEQALNFMLNNIVFKK